MIKGKSPYPFEKIALAVSFNPGLPLLIEETKRLCLLHNAVAVFIHVGKRTGDKQRELAALLTSNDFHDSNSRIFWEQGDIINSILNICKNEVVDLLIAGASDREDFKIPVGSTASGIATKAKCSVMIYTGRPSGSFEHIVVNGSEHRKSELTILTSIYITEKERAGILDIIDDNGGAALADTGNYLNQTFAGSRINIKEEIENLNAKVNISSLADENCKNINEFAFKNNSDLLITYSSDHHLLIFDRIPSDNGVDTFLNDLSCNLLVVHSRIPD